MTIVIQLYTSKIRLSDFCLFRITVGIYEKVNERKAIKWKNLLDFLAG